MDKLKLAHEYAKSLIQTTDDNVSMKQFVETCFNYAEAMLAENEKRTDKTRPDVLVSDEHKKESVHLNNLG